VTIWTPASCLVVSARIAGSRLGHQFAAVREYDEAPRALFSLDVMKERGLCSLVVTTADSRGVEVCRPEEGARDE
jgi:hypothetical protein